ncbi:hypothetical protein [Rubellimicrobium roseum]|uniref:Uncharacterized protein n=1 Tax=Rubellimicrobium roseum TaxID=687525 RepID=A0A5C4NHW8_9RHOB|nr:hypothetical protein [Rubellimicrobium roseum]TNC74361.1 hypothetical protein FHG71_04060 [Rubellimicrobium roseum]
MPSLPRKCPACSFVRPATVHACPSCGFKPERQSFVETIDGELVEIGDTASREPSFAERQRFWSMALSLDDERSKNGRLAKALYKDRFRVWPRGLMDDRLRPDVVFRAFECSRRIAYVKRRAKAEEACHAT